MVVVFGNGDDDGADGINCRNAKLAGETIPRGASRPLLGWATPLPS